MKLEHINNHLKYIQREDRVKGIKGTFKGMRGWCSRVNNDSACVCWKDIGFDHGIWVDISDLKRTKRYKIEKEFK